MSSCAVRPSAESVVSAGGRGCRQDAVVVPLSTQNWPTRKGGWKVGGQAAGVPMCSDRSCARARSGSQQTAVCAVGAVGEISPCGEAPQLVHRSTGPPDQPASIGFTCNTVGARKRLRFKKEYTPMLWRAHSPSY